MILAAGASRRLGEPKQLVEHEGRTLVRRAVEAAQAAGCRPVVVITGAHAERVEASLTGAGAAIVRNDDWPSGQGGSISVGARQVRAIAPACPAVLIALCDQPFVSPGHLRRLVQHVLEGRGEIAATRHADGRGGVPACFAASCLDDLAALSGDAGARALVRDPRRDATLFDAPSAHLDVDEPGDLPRLRGPDGPSAGASMRGDAE